MYIFFGITSTEFLYNLKQLSRAQITTYTNENIFDLEHILDQQYHIRPSL